MSDHSHHIAQYTAADIQRYLNGSMTATEMHAMEKAALEDPFLADAIEGMEAAMQVHGETPVNEKLDELRIAIAERIKPAGGKVRAITWWKISAAAVVVVAAGLFLWNSNSNNESAQKVVAVQTLKEKDTTRLVVPPATDEGFPAEFSTADSDVNAGKTVAKKSSPEKNQPNKKLSTDYSKAYAAAADEARAQQSRLSQAKTQTFADGKLIPLDTNIPAKVAPAPTDEKDLARRAENLRNQFNFSDTIGRPVNTEVVGHLEQRIAAVSINQADKSTLNNVIRGRVTDAFSRPIPNANLQTLSGFMNMGEAYRTDREGYFNIPTKENDTSALNISVAATGFTPQNFQLNRNAALNQLNTLQLDPANNTMSEVVVMGYGGKKTSFRKSKESALLQQNAEPVYGWVGYEKYLRESIRLPRDSAYVKGDVVVSFVVNRSGALSDITVISPLSPEADKEAIRLVKEGPAWKLKRGRKATTTVIVHF